MDASDRDAQHDFDFHVGTWTTHLERLQGPLSGSTSWVEYDGTTIVRPVWNGRANLVELEATGPSGSIEVMGLRLYNPEARKWSLNFASSRDGTLTPPAIGGFTDGRGEFFGDETLGSKPIVVRFVISDITPTSVRFEQSFSDDDGASWEPNWIAIDTRAA